jgi:hypothetical protein
MLRLTVRILGLVLLASGGILCLVNLGKSPVSSVSGPPTIHGSHVQPSSFLTDETAFNFNVWLHKSDLWFDTAIPVASGAKLWISCPAGTGPAQDCPHFLQAKIGTSTIPSVVPVGWPKGRPYILRAASEKKKSGELTIPIGDQEQSIRLRILPKGGPNDVLFAITVGIAPAAGSKDITPLQRQLHRSLMARMER